MFTDFTLLAKKLNRENFTKNITKDLFRLLQTIKHKIFTNNFT